MTGGEVSTFMSKNGYYPNDELRDELAATLRGRLPVAMSRSEARRRASYAIRWVRSNASRQVKLAMVGLGYGHSGRIGGTGEERFVFTNPKLEWKHTTLHDYQFQTVLRGTFRSKRGVFSVHDVAFALLMFQVHMFDIDLHIDASAHARYDEFVLEAEKEAGPPLQPEKWGKPSLPPHDDNDKLTRPPKLQPIVVSPRKVACSLRVVEVLVQ